MQRIKAVVGLLLCTALAVGVVSWGVAGEPKAEPVKLYEGQIKSIKVDKCGQEPGSCEGSVVLAPKGGGEEMTLAIQPGTWIQRGDKLVLLGDLSSPRQNYLYLCAELTRPCLFKGSFTSNHASQRQDEVSTREKSPCVNLRSYDEVIRPA